MTYKEQQAYRSFRSHFETPDDFYDAPDYDDEPEEKEATQDDDE